MIKKLIFIFVLISIFVAALILLPFPYLFGGGNVGSFNTFSGWYWCLNPVDCLHEQAHYIDWQNDWISSSDEYNLVTSGWLLGPNTENIAEAYAEIYVLFGGNVPERLTPFYQGHEHNFCIPMPRGKLCL